MPETRKTTPWIVVGIVVAIVLFVLYTAFEYTLVPDLRERFAGADRKAGVDLGVLLFDTRGCGSCHTLSGVSSSTIGPDLSTIADTNSASEIRTSIVDPAAETSGICGNKLCPVGLMPVYGEILDDREIDALVAFLLEYGKGEPNTSDH